MLYLIVKEQIKYTFFKVPVHYIEGKIYVKETIKRHINLELFYDFLPIFSQVTKSGAAKNIEE